MSKFELGGFCSLVEQYKVSVILLVPPIALLLARDPIVDKYNMSSLNLVISGAAPLGPELERDLAKRLNTNVTQAYGLTESSPTTHYCPISSPSPGSIGPLLPMMRGRICDPETGKDVKEGEQGEMLLQGPSESISSLQDRSRANFAALPPRRHYARLPQPTRSQRRDAVRGQGRGLAQDWRFVAPLRLHFFHHLCLFPPQSPRPRPSLRSFGSATHSLPPPSSDIAWVDKRGYYYITDRIKELIKYKGLQIAPAELEGTLLDCPFVADCAVIGVWVEEQATELPRAYVVVSVEGKKQGDPAKAIREWVDGKVSNHKKLRGGVRLVESVPKSPSGKLLRRSESLFLLALERSRRFWRSCS